MRRILERFGWWWNCWCRHCGQTRYNHPNGRMCKRVDAPVQGDDPEADPLVIPHERDRCVIAGGFRVKVNADEWVAAHLEPGENVVLHRRNGNVVLCRVLERSWFFDGVVPVLGTVREEGTEYEHIVPERGVFPDCGDRLWPERGAVMDSEQGDGR